mgnify:CR=1 FL=1
MKKSEVSDKLDQMQAFYDKRVQLIPKCSSSSLTVKEAEGGLYEVIDGVCNSDLRETFGFRNKSLNPQSVYLLPEEVLYAQ